MTSALAATNAQLQTLLNQAQSCLVELIESSQLDPTVLCNGCIEDFEDFDWEPLPTLKAEDLERWNALLEIGLIGEMTSEELSEFIELTSPEGQNHIYFYRVQARKLVNSIEQHKKLTANNQKISDSAAKAIEKTSKAAAATCLFDLESGEINDEVKKALSPEMIFDATTLLGSLSIAVDDKTYELIPYWPFLTEDNALEIMQDLQTAIEQELTQQHQALTQGQMVDWRILEDTPTPTEHRNAFSINVQMGNQVAIDIKQEDGEPSLGLLIEINHGTPALHVDLDGGDSLVHIHKGQDGLVITPDKDDDRFEQAEMDDLSYHSMNSIVIRQ